MVYAAGCPRVASVRFCASSVAGTRNAARTGAILVTWLPSCFRYGYLNGQETQRRGDRYGWDGELDPWVGVCGASGNDAGGGVRYRAGEGGGVCEEAQCAQDVHRLPEGSEDQGPRL